MSEHLKLPARLDLSAASDLVDTLRRNEGDLVIDATDVSHMGALCLQALVAASRKQTSQKLKFTFSGISEKASEQMGLMGISPQQLEEGTV